MPAATLWFNSFAVILFSCLSSVSPSVDGQALVDGSNACLRRSLFSIFSAALLFFETDDSDSDTDSDFDSDLLLLRIFAVEFMILDCLDIPCNALLPQSRSFHSVTRVICVPIIQFLSSKTIDYRL